MEKNDLMLPFDVQGKIMEVRNQSVLLDSDVAALYGVETRVVNQAVRNNPDKFPKGYVFQLDKQELADLRSKFLIANLSPKSRYLPAAFTEKGLYMLDTILKSKQATKATLAIVETYARVRELKRGLLAMHNSDDKEKQNTILEKFSYTLSDIVMPELRTEETESTLELNFIIGKLKHTVRRKRMAEGKDVLEDGDRWG